MCLNFVVNTQLEFSDVFHSIAFLDLVNILRPRQNGRYFADGISNAFSRMKAFKISLKYIPFGIIYNFDNVSALVQLKAWHRIGDKPLLVPMMSQFIDAYMPAPTLLSYDLWVNIVLYNPVYTCSILINRSLG